VIGLSVLQQPVLYTVLLSIDCLSLWQYQPGRLFIISTVIASLSLPSSTVAFIRVLAVFMVSWPFLSAGSLVFATTWRFPPWARSLFGCCVCLLHHDHHFIFASSIVLPPYRARAAGPLSLLVGCCVCLLHVSHRLLHHSPSTRGILEHIAIYPQTYPQTYPQIYPQISRYLCTLMGRSSSTWLPALHLADSWSWFFSQCLPSVVRSRLNRSSSLIALL